MHTVSIEEAAAHLPELIAEACGGGEVVIAKRGTPAVRLTPMPSKPAGAGEAAHGWPLLGLLKGKVRMAPDFDEPLEDFRPYME
jgi:prevent-host-death family protein